MKILIDIGGSGLKIAAFTKDGIGPVRKHFANDPAGLNALDPAGLAKLIKNTAGERVSGIAMSVAGYVDSKNGEIIHCNRAERLQGDIARELRKSFLTAKIAVVNDGEAHARSLLYPGRNVRFGAIHLAFGSAVAFGVIDERGKIIYNCSGGNWDISGVKLNTSREPSVVWESLGHNGLKILEDDQSVQDTYCHFGWRMGAFAKNLAWIFHPRTIGLSGGIMSREHIDDIMRGFWEVFSSLDLPEKVDVLPLVGDAVVMEGLTTLL